MRIRIFLLFIFFVSSSVLKAQDDSLANISKLTDLPLEELMNVHVITASGYVQNISDAPSTITVITAKQIAERGYEQLEDALRDVPGIDMIHINGYAPTLIYFRGMYGAENLRALLMIDGVVENNILGTNDMAGPAYSLHNAARIEIIWGPVSALYGANAFGGVINIITKKGADINGFHAEQGFGTFNTRFEKINMGLRKSKFEFAAAGTLYSTDGPKFANRDPDYSNSYVDKAYSFNGSLSYYAKKSETTLSFRTYKTPMGWGTFFNSPTMFLGLPSQGYDNKGVLGLLSRDVRGEKGGLTDPYLRTVFLENEFKPNQKLKLLSRIVYRETGTADDSYAYLTLDGKKLIRGILTSYSNRISGEFSVNYAPSEKQVFSAGIQYYRDNVEKGGRRATLDTTNNIYLIDGRDTVSNIYSTFLPRQYDIRTNFGSFFQYVLHSSLLGKTNITVGARYDYNSYFGGALNPRISLVNQPGEKFTFKFQFGTAFRAPTNTEIYQTGLNFELKTEKIKTYEVNAIYAPSKKFRAQLNLFRNELSDVIVISGLAGLNADKNPGAETINGLESTLDMIVAKNISGFLNFTYQDATGRNFVTHFSGDIPDVAKFKGNAGLTTHIEDIFTISLIENWIGKRKVPGTDPYGPVPGYLLTNFVISTGKLFNKGITASLNIRNIFNTKWLDPGFRTADGFLFSTVLEQPGINGLFKIGIDL
jgi:outer membrane receptor for ferrienterochelin and colicins